MTTYETLKGLLGKLDGIYHFDEMMASIGPKDIEDTKAALVRDSIGPFTYIAYLEKALLTLAGVVHHAAESGDAPLEIPEQEPEEEPVPDEILDMIYGQ